MSIASAQRHQPYGFAGPPARAFADGSDVPRRAAPTSANSPATDEFSDRNHQMIEGRTPLPYQLYRQDL